ncbi:MAG TPA: cytochrome c oxidase subunit II [Puia sp.]|nr:cytochrome c oxidase subunit II [Puia sp.]
MYGFKWIFLDVRPSSIFSAASPQAERIRSLTAGFLAAAAAILLLVVVLTVLFAIRYRSGRRPKEPEQVSGNRRLELAMIGVPLLLVTGFFFWSMRTMNAVLPDRGQHRPDVIITGRQWFWQASYPGTGVMTANEIHLPVGRRLLLQLNAGDVIHDWWVPALGGKMDMIPGVDNYLWVTIRETGIYEGACSEFCGQEHAWMRIRVVAESEEDYARWLVAEGAVARSPFDTGARVARDTLAQAGAPLFLSATCGSCHRVAGTAANGVVGPDLTHFAVRQTMLAGMQPNDSEHVAAWLADPQRIKPGAHMPRFILPPDSIRALTAYLEQLK